MYKTLYRAYRPQTFETIIDQNIITSTLQNAIKENKIAHSYLFSGRSGTGKTTLAKIFAKAINCEGEQKPCNVCKVCVLINKEQIIDVVEIDAASNNGIEQIRNLIESIQYPPIVCKYKVYIIDEVHMLSNAAFNALLKTLEEPPINTVFILATTEEHKIPETILTRCQRYNFQKISVKNIANLVGEVLAKENKNFDIAATELISDMSNGSVRKALSITEQCMHLESKLTVDAINKAYGLLTTDELIALVVAIHDGNKSRIEELLNVINEKGSHYQRLLEEILFMLKEMLISSISSNYTNKKFINSENIAKLNFSDGFIFKMIERIKETLSQIAFSSNPKLNFEISIYQLASINSNLEKKEVIKSKIIKKEIIEKEIPEEIQKQEVVEKIINKESEEVSKLNLESVEKIKSKIIKKETPEEIQKQEIVEKTTNKELEVEKEKFNKILNVLLVASKLEKEKFVNKWPSLNTMSRDPENSRWISMLSNSQVVASSPNALVVMFEYEPSAKMLNSSNEKQGLLGFVKKTFGREYLIFGTWKEAWLKEVENYKVLKSQNALPIYKPIIVPRHKEKTIFDQTEVKIAQEKFGDLLEINK